MSDQLTIDELRAYQAGLLSGPERHRVEQLLLENPFYADALEGLEALQQSGKSLTKQSSELRHALQERIHESATEHRLMPLWMTSAAASVILVMCVAIYLIYFMRPVFQPVDSSKPMVFEVEMTPAAPVAKATADSEQVARATQPATNVQPETGQPQQATDASPSGQVGAARKPTITKAEQAEPLAATIPDKAPQNVLVAQTATKESYSYSVKARKTNRDSVNTQLNQTLPTATATGKPAEQPARVASDVYPRAAASAVPSMVRAISGVITDAQNYPLPGVTVVINGTNRGVVTDGKGAFKLDSLQQNAQLTANFIGYQSKTFLVSELIKGPVQLREDVKSLSEVVITGYNSKDKQSVTPKLHSSATERFEAFVNQNRQLPANAANQGQVVVQFKVQSDGSIHRLRVKQSAGQVFDQEAVRLIRTYGQWPTGWQEVRVAL